MFTAPSSPFLVPFDGSFSLADAPASVSEPPSDKKLAKMLKKRVKRFAELQRMLYAEDEHALLLVFQAMDAAGKDSTIRTVTSGVNPAGFQVNSFKRPTSRELDQDFLWRTTSRMPERGRIGVFNRSYYEEVLVVRVHPEFLAAQRLPQIPELPVLWAQRYRSINDLERHLAENGTVVLKFWLNVSREEQKRRFLDRIDTPRKHWKFSSGDVHERVHWDRYMLAYEEALRATSSAHAPWYAIPADSKPFMRHAVADIVVRALESLDLSFPRITSEHRQELKTMRQELENEQIT
jgi:PPK2 family polyphosphate:nucleotide phosphotransferase